MESAVTKGNFLSPAGKCRRRTGAKFEFGTYNLLLDRDQGNVD